MDLSLETAKEYGIYDWIDPSHNEDLWEEGETSILVRTTRGHAFRGKGSREPRDPAAHYSRSGEHGSVFHAAGA